jgi:glycerol uptake facilitator-like aquaporin
MENVSPTEAVVAHEPEEEARASALSGAGVRYAYLLAGAGLIGLVFCWLQFSTRAVCCGDLDGYYHIKWSQTLWQSLRARHFPPRFTWLPLTTLNARDYVDHHLLFHLLEIPFTFFRDLRFGAKVSAALFGTLAVCSCYWLVWRYRLRYPLVWLLALLGCSAPFLYRMNMTKAMSVSVVLLVVGIHLLFQRRYIWLLPLAFVFTETYDMFVLLALAVAIWIVVETWSERNLAWQAIAKMIMFTLVGIALGLVLNPYFPHNLRLFYEHVVMKVAVADANRPRVGNEWYPYETWDFFRNSLVACAAMVAGYVAFTWEDRRRAARPLFFLIFSTILLIAHAKWRRFAEYWPPFAVLFAAFAVQAAIERARASYGRLPADVQNELEPYLDAHAPPVVPVATTRRGEDWGLIAATVVALVLATAAGFSIYAETKEIRESAPPQEYSAGCEWLRTHVAAGEVVFNTDWDDFPKLFYYDPSHAYVSGLDPTYLYDANPELSKLYEQITLGKVSDPGPLIRERFGARYVFTDNEDVHDDFYNAAMDSGWFEEVYTDEDCTILHIRDQKGEPPPDTNEGNTPDEGDSNDNDEDNAPGDNETLNMRPHVGGQIA